MKISELVPRRMNPLLHRVCPQCEAKMWLTVIEPDAPGHDRCIFECRKCQHRESIVLKVKDA